MNCLDYRRELGIDPRSESAEMQAHRRECTACAHVQTRARAQEVELRRALDMPVPTGLAERILLAQVTGTRTLHRKRGGFAVALAAAALLCAAMIGAGWWASRSPSLAPLVVDHIAHEPQSLDTHSLLDAFELRQHFAARGVTLAADPPPGVSYAANCPVGPYRSVHMVMPKRGGPPVTVFYLAGHREPTRSEFHEGRMMRGRSVPMGEGTLVLVAHIERDFDAIEHDWRVSIEGPATSVVAAR